MSFHPTERWPKVTFTGYEFGDIVIGDVSKGGTTSVQNTFLKHAVHGYEGDDKKIPLPINSNEFILWQGGTVKSDKKYIILLRDPISRWLSGYKTEFMHHPVVVDSGVQHWFRNSFYEDGYKGTGKQESIAREVISFLHDTEGFGQTNRQQRWMYKNHGRFWQWNSASILPLNIYAYHPQVYFMHMDDLSRPEFVNWCKENDTTGEWENSTIDVIGHENKTEDWFWPQMDMFWTQYSAGLILKDMFLIDPRPALDPHTMLYVGSIDPNGENFTEIIDTITRPGAPGNSIDLVDPLFTVIARQVYLDLEYIYSIFPQKHPDRYLTFPESKKKKKSK